ncbi:MAG: terminase large subunit domain-containing protein [Minisyncoccia bacterium]
MANEKLDTVLAGLEAAVERKTYWHMDFFLPYPKQKAYFDLGTSMRERMLFGANQSGKTEAGAFEVACHLTGRYPKWWNGRRFSKPVRCWVAGETSLAVRDTIQKKLCGEPGVISEFGKGMIPKSLFTDHPTMSRGVSDAYDTIQVRHTSGGISVLRFKSFEQGRGKFQGETLDFVWTDEECPMEIYTECKARITSTGGFLMGTFTPLKGRTDLVCHFLEDGEPDVGHVTMTLYEGHPPPGEDYATVIRGYPAHERDARVHGIPMLGSGRVFPYPEELIKEPSLPPDAIPGHWRKLWAVDFSHGGIHPFAAVLLVHDTEADVIHIHHTVKVIVKPGDAGGLPSNHAAAMKAVGIMVPVAWPHDGQMTIGGLSARDTASIAAQYRKEGLKMLGKWATFTDGGFGTEAGIQLLDTRMQNGLLKVGAHCTQWFEEYRNYHRDEGVIVKEKDDLMSATRIGVMQIRSAQPVPLGHRVMSRGPNTGIASGLDFMDEMF